MFTALFLALLQAAPAEDAPPQEIPLALRVNRAIALGVDYLKRTQAPDGSFPTHEAQHPGGMTAFVAYTLARCGMRRDDPVLVRALASLEGIEFQSVYSASAHLLLCETLRDPAREEAARASLDFLLEHQDRGVWAYPWGHLCNSNTQFALLALRAARSLGLAVPESTLVDALHGLDVFHESGGGYVYDPDRPESYAGMTAASLSSFAVLAEMAADSPRLRTALARYDGEREEAERWLARHFDPARNAYGDGTWRGRRQQAFLWAVERWCGLTGREKVGAHDWYGEGAAWLVDHQARDGSFADRGLEDTCFALLFLRRATVTEAGDLDGMYAAIDRQRWERPAVHWRAGAEARRLTEWWLAGPWAQEGGGALLLDLPFDPADAKPRERGKIARREWERVVLKGDGWEDLDRLTARKGDGQVWLLSTWLDVAGAEPVEALLWLELEDGWDVWLDGERLSRERRRVPIAAPDVSIPLQLGPGEHLLSVVVEDLRGVAAFGALLTSRANGGPPAGLSARATPSETPR